ncbi:unnamed protein product [Linum tenue]|uniref:F-box domain-containing protein n=1 Tax=Linum tenue TaxID=586396 RepID=A0AAV0JVT8_9ROSI|nr:unnamed protein product [Linum tenue]
MISQLGDDLLVQILIRLPDPRPACRCKSVCKRWNSLISTPSFNRRFVHHHRSSNHHLPLPDDPNELQSTIRRLGFLPRAYVLNDLRVLDCFKDLVLCGFWDLYNNNDIPGRSYLICNPFTKQWVALPLAPKKRIGYEQAVARLVCEPRNPKKLYLGDDRVFVYPSEYRFRVVCIYSHMKSVKLDLFCSESGKWTKEALVRPGHIKIGNKNVTSWNGELLWVYIETRDFDAGRIDPVVAAWNPFRIDIPPTCIDVSAFYEKERWDISVSQGALHVVALEERTVPTCSSVWRLEEDRKSWKKQRETLLKTAVGFNYKSKSSCLPFLHPNNPEVVFLHCRGGPDDNAILSCDLRRGELEFFAKLEVLACRFTVLQPIRVACWPTPIPRYEELREACTMEVTAFGFRAALKQLLRP